MRPAQEIHDLFQAAQAGDVQRLQEMLSADPALANTENEDGLTPLGFAAHFGHPDAVRALLEHGADVNAVSHSTIAYIPSNTALHAAIAGERNLEVIRLLLQHGARTDIFDSNGHTCLHTAAFHDDNCEIIRLLIEHGVPVNAQAAGGKTALALAIEKGNHNVAQLLRQHGASE
ncbi:ankyrin repeat domain-containing protein [Brevibacillus sp. SYP-B805]|uniref:ankyrin repeat domain-containing protein n=1 Tax=Brevibacillus sp. SYP-B805 TaxID=1578199 RepID=UPI0013EDE3A4|nr:ankyrin repeat domain-containing protein [Brevibacillus sp. SYP-B805]NGQ95142.1 ankyrin repeat domain-containing protein [Brevibacillus sp. SYP-B805]